MEKNGGCDDIKPTGAGNTPEQPRTHNRFAFKQQNRASNLAPAAVNSLLKLFLDQPEFNLLTTLLQQQHFRAMIEAQAESMLEVAQAASTESAKQKEWLTNYINQELKPLAAQSLEQQQLVE